MGRLRVLVFLGFRWSFLRHHAIWLYVIMVITLLGILIPNPLVQNINGATRWYRFAGLSFQPSEVVKSIFIFVLAHFAVKYQAQNGNN